MQGWLTLADCTRCATAPAKEAAFWFRGDAAGLKPLKAATRGARVEAAAAVATGALAPSAMMVAADIVSSLAALRRGWGGICWGKEGEGRERGG